MSTPEEIRRHYDSLALVYRTFWGDHIHHGLFFDHESPGQAQVRMLEYCVDLLPLRGGEAVLDAGCGYGATLLYLAQRFDCRGTGITISSRQVQVAGESAVRAGLDDRLQFVVEDIEEYPFPAQAFDLVWAMESSEHFRDKLGFFCKSAFSLRPGGRLLLAAWTGLMANRRVAGVSRVFLCPELWTAEQYLAAIETAGLHISQSEDLTSKVIRTWEICRERAQLAGPAIKLLPRAAREFVQGIDLILDAYRAGDLTYTVITAEKPSETCATPS